MDPKEIYFSLSEMAVIYSLAMMKKMDLEKKMGRELAVPIPKQDDEYIGELQKDISVLEDIINKLMRAQRRE